MYKNPLFKVGSEYIEANIKEMLLLADLSETYAEQIPLTPEEAVDMCDSFAHDFLSLSANQIATFEKRVEHLSRDVGVALFVVSTFGVWIALREGSRLKRLAKSISDELFS
jgi:predicted glycosyl hydrolase (DUF1957 family)